MRHMGNEMTIKLKIQFPLATMRATGTGIHSYHERILKETFPGRRNGMEEVAVSKEMGGFEDSYTSILQTHKPGLDNRD